MATTLAELRASPHLSISQLKTFIRCPRLYRLRHVDRVEPAFRSAALAFGSAWHATIDEFLLRATPGEPVARVELHDVLNAELEREFLRDGPPVLFDHEDESFSGFLTAGARMLDAFLMRVPVPERVVGIEIPFGIPLTDPETGEVIPVDLVGSIDAVVTTKGKTALWELKTGKKRWTADQVEYDIQPTAYTIASRQLGHEPDLVELIVTTKTLRPEVQVERLHRGIEDERDLFAIAASTLKAVAAGCDHPVRTWACRTCPVAGVCR